jgi:hypothetical protein
MSQEYEITLTIKGGEVTYEVNGVTGKTCHELDLVKYIRENTGEVVSTTDKPEVAESPQQIRTRSDARVNQRTGR